MSSRRSATLWAEAPKPIRRESLRPAANSDTLATDSSMVPASRRSSPPEKRAWDMKWMWVSKPPAVRILPSPAMASVEGPMMMLTPGWVSGLPALPIAAMVPFLRPTSAL